MRRLIILTLVAIGIIFPFNGENLLFAKTTANGWSPPYSAVKSETECGEACSPDPFTTGEVWEGMYLCRQGWTDLKLHIIDRKDDVTKAIFEFSHLPTRVHGSYYLVGQYNSKSQRMTFVPGDWISRPPGYIAVGMDGRVINDRRFEGEITYCTCGGFHLQRAGRSFNQRD